jgi:hypothetical protein
MMFMSMIMVVVIAAAIIAAFAMMVMPTHGTSFETVVDKAPRGHPWSGTRSSPAPLAACRTRRGHLARL